MWHPVTQNLMSEPTALNELQKSVALCKKGENEYDLELLAETSANLTQIYGRVNTHFMDLVGKINACPIQFLRVPILSGSETPDKAPCSPDETKICISFGAFHLYKHFEKAITTNKTSAIHVQVLLYGEEQATDPVPLKYTGQWYVGVITTQLSFTVPNDNWLRTCIYHAPVRFVICGDNPDIKDAIGMAEIDVSKFIEGTNQILTDVEIVSADGDVVGVIAVGVSLSVPLKDGVAE